MAVVVSPSSAGSTVNNILTPEEGVVPDQLVGYSTDDPKNKTESDASELRRQYQTYLSEHGNDLQTLIALATLEGNVGNLEAMVRHLDTAIEAYPDAVVPRLVLGRYYLLTKAPEKAESVLSGAGESAKSNPLWLSAMSAAQIENGNFTGAQETLERLAAFEPDKPSVFYLQARVYAELKKPSLSEMALKKTLALDPSHFPARLALARLLVLQGKADEAKPHLDILLEEHGNHPDVIALAAALNKTTTTE